MNSDGRVDKEAVSGPFNVQERLTHLDLAVEIVDTYSEKVYLVEQQIRNLFAAIVNNDYAYQENRKIIKHLINLQILIEVKIRKKEGYEAVMRQVTFDY